MYNEELQNLYALPIIRVIKSRRIRWVGHVARMGGRCIYRILVGRPKGEGPLGKPSYRWEDNIKMDLTGDRDRRGELDSAGSG
jgi:hypothetical protein